MRILWFTVLYVADRLTVITGNHTSLVTILDMLSQVKKLAGA